MHSQSYSQHRHDAGFTLIEAIIAVSILAVGVVSLLVLTTQSYTVGSVLGDQFIASNIAREGIEIVRAQRDSNWLAFDSDGTTEWNDGLEDAGDITAVVTTHDSLSSTHFDFAPDTETDECGIVPNQYTCATVWRSDVEDNYFQTASDSFNPSAAGIVDTGYRRLVTLTPLCRHILDDTDETTSAIGCAPPYEQVGVVATVTVSYSSQAGTAEYVLEEQLYNWKF